MRFDLNYSKPTNIMCEILTQIRPDQYFIWLNNSLVISGPMRSTGRGGASALIAASWPAILLYNPSCCLFVPSSMLFVCLVLPLGATWHRRFRLESNFKWLLLSVLNQQRLSQQQHTKLCVTALNKPAERFPTGPLSAHLISFLWWPLITLAG